MPKLPIQLNSSQMAANVKLCLATFAISYLVCELQAVDDGGTCSAGEEVGCQENSPTGRENKYVPRSHWQHYQKQIELTNLGFKPYDQVNNTHYDRLIEDDLKPWKGTGITPDLLMEAKGRGTHYQIINHKLYRENDCMFPFRCSGVEYFILQLIDKLPDMEFILNTRDWPQVPKYWKQLPVFSFSKNKEYWDIIYPAWTFWEGGPAISLYPTGIGRWDLHRESIPRAANKFPWQQKKAIAFFRGSRTSADRDPLILLSRSSPDLVDAQYTKNQAWKSDADTLHAPPAQEVSFDDHCQFKYLFNFRGVAASFRFKHLFLCRSLVFHVEDDWIEFFYPLMKPWVHYIPINKLVGQEDIEDLLEFARQNDSIAKQIADRGFEFIQRHLRMADVMNYWTKLLTDYAKLMRFKPHLDATLKEIYPLS